MDVCQQTILTFIKSFKLDLTKLSDKLKKNRDWFYSMVRLGCNYRMPDINASLGISQLKRLVYFKENQ